MLSRLFASAKSLLNLPPQIENTSDSETKVAYEEMVTTRRMGKPAEDGGDDSIVVEMPKSSKKRQRKSGSVDDLKSEEIGASGSASKRVKQLPVRVKEDDSPSRSARLVVEIPVGKLPTEARGSSVARSSVSPVPKEVNEIANSEGSEDFEDIDQEPEDASEESEKEQETTSKTNRGSMSPKPSPGTHKEPNPVKEESSPRPAAAKPKHKRFGSEEPEVEFFSTAVERVESEDDSSDDDEAPEVVGAQAAQKSVELKARDAAKAIKGQESAIRQKRKQRDAALKKQADAASKKRKRTAVEESTIPAKARRSEDPKSFTRGPLPDLLPAEFLEDDDDESLAHPDPEFPVKKAKKMKFTDLVERKPKDIRRGSTIYRVSEIRSTKLAPKASVQARSLKESWLQGRPGKLIGTNRMPWASGFFKKK